MPKGALTNLKVLDLTTYRAGPYCTKLLADFGAEVIKIEKPATGDPMRSIGPFVDNKPGLERSIPFHWLNTNKQSITLNLQSRELFDELLSKVDVLVESFSPEDKKKWNLDYARINKINPSLIMTSISNFGQTGPYQDYQAEEIVINAMSGSMMATGDHDRQPLCPGPAVAQYTAGLHAYLGTLIALFRRGISSEGDHVDVSIHESALENIELQLVGYLHHGKVARRNNDEHLLVPWQLQACQDGYVAAIGAPVRHWLKAAPMFEEPRLLEEPYRHMSGRIQHRQEFEALFKPWLERHNKKDIYHMGQSRGLSFGHLASLAEAFQSKQHEARNFFVETEPHPVVGTLRICSSPFRGSSSSWQTGRAPLLGEHNEQIYGNLLNYSATELAHLKEEGAI
jgi:crotonobetainyl-CoA:carnitine CoA-transferase CaiB-like acyl-CoA transferase